MVGEHTQAWSDKNEDEGRARAGALHACMFIHVNSQENGSCNKEDLVSCVQCCNIFSIKKAHLPWLSQCCWKAEADTEGSDTSPATVMRSKDGHCSLISRACD